MKTILQINTSLFGEQGQSSKLTWDFIEAWRQRNPQDRIISRDLAKDPVPHLTGERFQAFLTPAAEHTPEQRQVVAYSDALIEELRQADVIVLGLPMYNFGVPSTLKAYFDHVARAGVTFRYTANGPEGLLRNKKVYVLAARGGAYQGTALDTQTQYVTNFLKFLGMQDIEFVYAEGLALGEEKAQAALEQVQTQIATLAA
jgi:FMN-dependent NADH-azoreductase